MKKKILIIAALIGGFNLVAQTSSKLNVGGTSTVAPTLLARGKGNVYVEVICKFRNIDMIKQYSWRSDENYIEGISIDYRTSRMDPNNITLYRNLKIRKSGAEVQDFLDANDFNSPGIYTFTFWDCLKQSYVKSFEIQLGDGSSILDFSVAAPIEGSESEQRTKK